RVKVPRCAAHGSRRRDVKSRRAEREGVHLAFVVRINDEQPPPMRPHPIRFLRHSKHPFRLEWNVEDDSTCASERLQRTATSAVTPLDFMQEAIARYSISKFPRRRGSLTARALPE